MKRNGQYGFYADEMHMIRAIGRNVWALARPLMYYSEGLDREIIVPAGFATDFASIPRLLWRVFPKNDIYDAAAVLHDFGYAGHFSRAVSDALFHEAMVLSGVPKRKAFVMFLAVRLFGRFSYKGKRDAV